MKTVNFFTLVLLLMAWSGVNAQEKKIAWDYPVKTGSKEWAKFESNKEKVDACQIPENILSVISTEDLLELILKYPLIIWTPFGLKTIIIRMFS